MRLRRWIVGVVARYAGEERSGVVFRGLRGGLNVR